MPKERERKEVVILERRTRDLGYGIGITHEERRRHLQEGEELPEGAEVVEEAAGPLGAWRHVAGAVDNQG